MALTEKAIRNLTPPESGSMIVVDGEVPGLGVRITSNGVVSFVLSYWFHGRKTRYAFARWPELSLEAARNDALNMRNAIRQGKDPADQKRQQNTEPTITDLGKQYLEEYATVHKRATSIRNDRQMINGILLPRWGTRQVKAISKRDVQTLHASMKATPYRANRMVSLLSRMFNLAVEWEYRDNNPARGGKTGIKKFNEKPNDRWLDKDELTRLDAALDGYSDQNAANAIRLLLLTGSREGEVLKADWSHFDMKREVWTKPSHHTKQRTTEHVPLSKRALDVLTAMKPKASGPLFPGAGGNGDPRVTLRRPWVQVCKAAGLCNVIETKGKRRKITRYKPTARIHDLRHTYASHLVSKGVSLHLVGELLGHTNPNTTKRYAHVADEALRNATNQF